MKTPRGSKDMRAKAVRTVVALVVTALVSALFTTAAPTPAAAANTEAFNLKWGLLGGAAGSFHLPQGMAIDSSGNIYVADQVNDRIQVFNRNGVFVRQFGTTGTGNGQFTDPRDVAVLANNVYVADTGNHRIQVFTLTGGFVRKWGSVGSGNGQFTSPRGVVARGSQVWVADAGNNRIQRFSTTGTFELKWGSLGTTNGKFTSPRDVTLTRTGQVVVVDNGNNRIQVFNESGTFLRKFGTLGSGNGQLDDPRAVAVDPNSDDVLVADYGNDRFQRFMSTGTFIEAIGSFGTGNAQFRGPGGILSDGIGNVFVADTNNNRIQRFGFVSTARPPFVRAWGAEGTGPSQFHEPGDLAVDTFGNVYVADAGNDRVQKFDPAGSLLQTIPVANLGTAIAVDASGNIYVSTSGQIMKLSPAGSVLTQWAAVTGALAISPATGNVVAGDSTHQTVRVFSPTGALVNEFGGSGAVCQGNVVVPTGVTVDNSGNVYVVDTNNCIQKFAELGGGNLIDTWSSDGPAPGQLDGATQLALDPGGNILAADAVTETVSQWNNHGDLLTRWGGGSAGALGTVGNPQGVAADSLGNVYVVNGAGANGPRLQRFAVPGTLAGTVSGPSGPAANVFVVALQGGTIIRGMTANAAGVYSMPVPPGRYTLGFVDLSGANVIEWFDNHDQISQVTPADLRVVQSAATTTTNVTLAAAPGGPPPNPASLSGTVTGPPGPLAGIVVIAADFATGRVKGAVTNASGAYSITGLTPSSGYRLEFIDPTIAVGSEWHSNRPLSDVAGATVLNLTAGSSTAINAQLEDNPDL